MTFEEFVEKNFNGDKESALAALAQESYSNQYTLTQTKQNLQRILDELSMEDSEKFMVYWGKEVEKNPKNFQDAVETAVHVSLLNLSYDDVKKAKINPYKAEVGKAFLKLLIGAGGLLGLAAILHNSGQVGLAANVGTGLYTLFITYAGADFVDKIVKYFNFKKVKQRMDEIEKEEGGKIL